MSVSLIAAEQGAGDGSPGPARNQLLPAQLANALAPAAAPQETSWNRGAITCLQSLARQFCGRNQAESAAYEYWVLEMYPSLGITCYGFPQAVCLGSTEMCWILRNCQVLKVSANVRGIMKTQLCSSGSQI